jgi:hypothetical protein
MNIDKAVLLLAGIIILASLLLSQLHSLYWLWLTALIGLNLTQTAITGFCPTAKFFKKIGLKPGTAFQ